MAQSGDKGLLAAHQLPIRVAYYETDGQRRVHHANYLNYFERGRVGDAASGGVELQGFGRFGADAGRHRDERPLLRGGGI